MNHTSDREPTQLERLEYALVSGAAGHLAQQPHMAREIADGIKTVLATLRAGPVTPTLPEPADDQDFLSGVKACDITDGTCEACQ